MKKPSDLAERLLGLAKDSSCEDDCDDPVMSSFLRGEALGYWSAARWAASHDGLDAKEIAAWAGEMPPRIAKAPPAP